ncbi:site-specific integrase [Mycobacterium heckeshornense]|uniref:Site-specific integrase n=1 Tax=Mycobacterium heckeshornense TaxID=110505 RepID=A0A2G8BDU9_9MYCO|nr:site-specific integrase [Mycobacterium heckeshornense]KMV15290.1 integrase [Mycobacterium heckeshornense]MCV7035105.1 site-specific integrase [Mycobacterium heckeshornense]PIJ35836.1 site-specific integrase [Mycobacterium heckeshornense]BCO36019.1 site-specific integrase [Mycobacterium heckeshornense]
MARNANGEGSIYKRMRNGRPAGYVGALPYHDDNGETKRVRVYAPTRAEVRNKLRKVRERIESGAPARDAKMPVGAWLAHWRATTLAASDRKQATRELYSNLSRRHLEPEPFGAIRLDKLKPSDVETLVLALRAKTKPPRTEGEEVRRALSDSTIRQTYTVLRAGLDGAVRDGLLAKNPAAAVKRPGVARTEARHPDPDAAAAVLKHAAESRYHTAVVLIAATGLRRGEVLALTWDRVDLDAGLLKVAATIGRVGGQLVVSEPKTARSRRTVPLAPAVVEVLRKHKATQAAERLRAGNQWRDSGLVFTTELGGPVDPRNLLRVVEVAAKAAKVDGVGVHTLRHSAAVAWLEAGVHIKAVADLLGHSSIAVTGDVYGHTSDDAARAAVDGLSSALGI